MPTPSAIDSRDVSWNSHLILWSRVAGAHTPQKPPISLNGLPLAGGRNQSAGHISRLVSGILIFACTYHPVVGNVNLPSVGTTSLIHG